ncbi:MAG TPA: TonB family protein, partial [Flavobacteriaceae bacterium]
MKHVIILSLVFIPFFSFAQEAENTKKNNEIYQESPPEFPGGMRKFYSYVYKEMTYPKDAKKNSIQGKVLVQFEIGTNGKVTPSSIKIVQGLTESIDAEARR